MIFEIGEKVHIVERRFFTDDLRRHFVGEVIQCTDYAFRIVGYTWAFDSFKGEFTRKPEKRVRVIFGGERHTINIIPRHVNIEEIKYVRDQNKGLVATDGKGFSLEISEFTLMR